MVKLTIQENGTLKFEWTGKKGTGSLYQIAAQGNVDLVNELGLREIWCAMLCAKFVPFPLGGGEKAYRSCLEKWDAGEIDRPDLRTEEEKAQQELPGMEDERDITPEQLGRLRKWAVQKAGEGMNAPHDSYLRIAHDIAIDGKVKPSHRY